MYRLCGIALTVLQVGCAELEARRFVEGARDDLKGGKILEHYGNLDQGLRLKIRTDAGGSVVVGSGGDDAFATAERISVWEIGEFAPMLTNYPRRQYGDENFHPGASYGLGILEMDALERPVPEVILSRTISDLSSLVATFDRVEKVVASLPACPASVRLPTSDQIVRLCRLPAAKQFELNNAHTAAEIHTLAREAERRQ